MFSSNVVQNEATPEGADEHPGITKSWERRYDKEVMWGAFPKNHDGEK